MSLRLRADVSTTATDDGLVLLDERAGRYWQLNPTGAYVLSVLLNGATPAQAAAMLADQYAISVDQATGDVTALVDQLRAAGLIAG
jgi:hypothetical protein